MAAVDLRLNVKYSVFMPWTTQIWNFNSVTDILRYSDILSKYPCQCQYSLMSVPGGQVRRHRMGSWHPVTRGGSHSPDVDFVSIIRWHKAGLGPRLQFQVFTGHRKGKGDAALYCVPRPLIGQECHQRLLIAWCLMWAPNMGHWPITRHYLTLHPALITIISPWHNCHQSVQTLPCISIIMTSNEWS